MKRSSSNQNMYDQSATNPGLMSGANGSSGSSMSTAEAAKKARFVSDGNINVSSLGMSSAGGNGTGGGLQSNTASYSGMPGSAPAGAHHGFSASLGSIASAGNTSPQASRRDGSQSGYNSNGPASAGVNRGFTGLGNNSTSGYNGMQSLGAGGMGMSASGGGAGNGGVGGSPSQTYLQQQPYPGAGSPPQMHGQPAPLSIPPNAPNMPGLSSPGGSNNGGGFSPPGSNAATSPFLMNMMPAMMNGNPGPQSAGPGGMMNMPNMQGILPNSGHQSAGVYGNFPSSPFAGAANSPGMGSFMPNVGMLAGAQGLAQGTPSGRTVYVGNLPADASVDEMLNLVKFGPIENVKLLPEKSCAFISFLDGATAAAFHADACVKKITLHNQELKIGWGKPSACPTQVLMAVQQNQATRNVYLGQLDEEVTEQTLRDDLSRFGPIDQVKIVRDKNIGFVHFLSISTAMKVLNTLPTEPEWEGKRVSYGKDRCAYVPKSQQQNQAHNSQAAAMGMAAAASLGYPTAYSPSSPAHFAQYASMGSMSPAGPMSAGGSRVPSASGGPQTGDEAQPSATALSQIGNRTVYLGNIHPDTTVEEICNHIRGGILQNIRHIPEKHIAFVTFVDPNTALAFFHLATYSGVMIHNRRLKIGWGKHSGPLSPAIAMAVQAGGSRNVYVGNIEDSDFLNEEKLRRDFGDFGEIELVNSLKEKNCAFINFCNIQNAIKAIEAMKNHADYQSVKISYGKDRCGNPPRVIAPGGTGRKSSNPQSPLPAGVADEEDGTGLTPSNSGGAEGMTANEEDNA